MMPPQFFFNGNPSFGHDQVKAQIKKAFDKSAKKAEKLLKQPTQTWKHKVTFTTDAKEDEVTISTDDPPYGYLDDGTRAHPISATHAPTLVFPHPGFVAKTTVGSLNAGPGAVGSNIVYPTYVWHPGNKARNFTEQVIKDVEPEFLQDIEDALNAALIP